MAMFVSEIPLKNTGLIYKKIIKVGGSWSNISDLIFGMTYNQFWIQDFFKEVFRLLVRYALSEWQPVTVKRNCNMTWLYLLRKSIPHIYHMHFHRIPNFSLFTNIL